MHSIKHIPIRKKMNLNVNYYILSNKYIFEFTIKRIFRFSSQAPTRPNKLAKIITVPAVIKMYVELRQRMEDNSSANSFLLVNVQIPNRINRIPETFKLNNYFKFNE